MKETFKRRAWGDGMGVKHMHDRLISSNLNFGL